MIPETDNNKELMRQAKVYECFAMLQRDKDFPEFCWAEYCDTEGEDHCRLVDVELPATAAKSLALIRTYEGVGGKLRPKVLHLLGSTID